MSNHYEWSLRILGLSHGATDAEIKEAYRDLVSVWHPDKYTGNERLRRKAEEMLKQINEAKDYLDGKGYDPDWHEPEPPRPSGHPDPEQEPEPEPKWSEPHYDEVEDQWDSEPVANSNSNRTVTAVSWIAAIVTCLGLLGWLGYQKGLLGFTEPSKPTIAGNVDLSPVMDDDVRRALLEPEAHDMSLEEAESILSRAEPSQLSRVQSNSSATSNIDPDLLTLEQRANLEAEREFDPEEETTSTPKADVSYFKQLDSKTFEAPDGSQYQVFDGHTITQDELDQLEQYHEQVGRFIKKGKLPPGYFTIGSSEDEVKRSQGTPTRVSEGSWGYDFSSVEFENHRVVGYSSISGNLKVAVLPANRPKHSPKTFGIGSSKDEVLLVQGTPSRYSGDSWGYEFSSVEFKDGKVESYSNVSQNLNIK